MFLGAGRITSALVAGLRASGFRGRIVVCDRHAEKLRQLRRRYAVRVEPDPHRAAAQAGLLLVAVRPPDVLPLLAALGTLPPATVPVSLAAGVPLRTLESALRTPAGWTRAMPSPASRNRHGLTALAFARAAPRAARGRVRQFFERVGAALEIPEREFDAFTVVYSTSQGYHALASRVRAARRLGLSPRAAFVAAAHGLLDGLHSLGKGESSLEELLAEAATPGGIAGKVLETMHSEKYERLIERAYRAGLARARTVGRTS
ncbi:MAG TPA: NAD(P)-binding domain-containing protein [Candidatus Acidoferrales bacterium]|nr:NAD(P)-binding domain-containing protein [Candidatus Acidoferrales bacterium]